MKTFWLSLLAAILVPIVVVFLMSCLFVCWDVDFDAGSQHIDYLLSDINGAAVALTFVMVGFFVWWALFLLDVWIFDFPW